MGWNEYFNEVRRQLMARCGPDAEGWHAIPDGEYPMTIDGRLDRVRVEGGQIYCLDYYPRPER